MLRVWAPSLLTILLMTAALPQTFDDWVINGLRQAAELPGPVDEASIRALFGISDATYHREEIQDEFGSYKYVAVGSRPLTVVAVDNLPHYTGKREHQQQIIVVLPTGSCINPDTIKRKTGVQYESFMFGVHQLSLGGALFSFTNGQITFFDTSRSNMLRTEKDWGAPWTPPRSH